MRLFKRLWNSDRRLRAGVHDLTMSSSFAKTCFSGSLFLRVARSGHKTTPIPFGSVMLQVKIWGEDGGLYPRDGLRKAASLRVVPDAFSQDSNNFWFVEQNDEFMDLMMNFHGCTFIAGYTYKTHYIHNVSWVMLLELDHCSRNAGILRTLMCYYDEYRYYCSYSCTTKQNA